MRIPEILPMSQAPRDGTVIIAIYDDVSSVASIRWGFSEDDPHELSGLWFSSGWDNSVWEDDDGYAGWIPAPAVRWHGDDKLTVELPWGRVVAVSDWARA